MYFLVGLGNSSSYSSAFVLGTIQIRLFPALAYDTRVILILFLFFRNRAFIASVSENICRTGCQSGLCFWVHDAARVGIFYSRLEDAARSSCTAKPTPYTFLVVGGREIISSSCLFAKKRCSKTFCHYVSLSPHETGTSLSLLGGWCHRVK